MGDTLELANQGRQAIKAKRVRRPKLRPLIITVSVPAKLLQWLEHDAEANERKLEGEVVYLLKQAWQCPNDSKLELPDGTSCTDGFGNLWRVEKGIWQRNMAESRPA